MKNNLQIIKKNMRKKFIKKNINYKSNNKKLLIKKSLVFSNYDFICS